MPAVHLNLQPSLYARQSGATQSQGRRTLSGNAIGFVVPIFVVFLVAPFLCVYTMRRRRARLGLPPTGVLPAVALQRVTEKPEKRVLAREKLAGVTDVVDYAGGGGGGGESDGGKGGDVDALSVMERDCAICLSTLHAPSPPEPAKLVNEAIAADGADDAVKAGSMSNASLSEQEVILRLKVCGHEFHAECLTSWFSIRKHSCPICRAIYYTKTEEVVPDEQQQQPETQTIPAQESPSVPNGQRREEV